MKKIPTLFKRDSSTFRVIPELTPGCEWVMEGKGIITIKIDGQNCKVTYEDSPDPNKSWDKKPKLWRRLKPAQGEYDEASYIPCNRDDPADKYLFEAFDTRTYWSSGIYEAFGPSINGNHQESDGHDMIRIAPVDGPLIIPIQTTSIRRGPTVTVQELYDTLKIELEDGDAEGIVFHLEEAGMKPVAFAKIKRKDYGLKWPIAEPQKVVTAPDEPETIANTDYTVN